MTIQQVKEILKGNFANATDRKYWEDKLAELERKAATAANNEIYFMKNRVYDR